MFDENGKVLPEKVGELSEKLDKALRILIGDTDYFKLIKESNLFTEAQIYAIEEYKVQTKEEDIKFRFKILLKYFSNYYQYSRIVSCMEFYNEYKNNKNKENEEPINENEVDPDQYMFLTDEEKASAVNNDDTAVWKKY